MSFTHIISTETLDVLFVWWVGALVLASAIWALDAATGRRIYPFPKLAIDGLFVVGGGAAVVLVLAEKTIALFFA